MLVKVTIGVSYIDDVALYIKFGIFKKKLSVLKKEKPPKKVGKSVKKQPEKKKPRKKPPLSELIALFSGLIKALYAKFKKYLRIEEYRLRILLASDDPAKTALLYGTASAAAGSLYAFINNYSNRTKRKDRIYSRIEVDFLADDFELYLSAAFSMRVWQLLSVGVTSGKGLIKYMNITKQEEQNEQRDTA